jgi:hypothetical protein
LFNPQNDQNGADFFNTHACLLGPGAQLVPAGVRQHLHVIRHFFSEVEDGLKRSVIFNRIAAAFKLGTEKG